MEHEERGDLRLAEEEYLKAGDIRVNRICISHSFAIQHEFTAQCRQRSTCIGRRRCGRTHTAWHGARAANRNRSRWVRLCVRKRARA